MTHTPGKNDGKLLFAIAGGILVIAAGIAVLASLGSSGDDASRGVAAVPAVRTAEVEPVVLPATETSVLEEDSTSLVDLVEQTGVEPAFGVDPDADFVKEGVAAYESKRYDEAVAYFTAEADARPDRAWTHYILALSLWKSGAAETAATEMRRSIEIDGGQIKALVNLARIENDRGEFDAARSAAEEAVALAPDNGEAAFLLARSLYNVGDKEAALAALETSRDLQPDNGYAANLEGLIWIERGEATPAVDAMRVAAELLPDTAFVQNNFGMALELSGANDEAAAAYARAVALSPEHTRAAMNLARLDGRVPSAPEEETADPEPVVAVLTDESEIPD